MTAKFNNKEMMLFHIPNNEKQIPMHVAIRSEDPAFLGRLPDNMLVSQVIGVIKSFSTMDQIVVLLTTGLIVDQNKELIPVSTRKFDLKTIQTGRKVFGDIFDHQMRLQPELVPNITQNSEAIMQILNTLPSLSIQELAYVHGICGIAIENHPRFEESTIHKMYKGFGTKITNALKRITKGLI